jgi:hypothetical protein
MASALFAGAVDMFKYDWQKREVNMEVEEQSSVDKSN